jgi:hypothetical protein
MHPKHPLAAELKPLVDRHVLLSELGIPAGDLHLIAESVCYTLGIQLSKVNPPFVQLKFDAVEI